MTEAKQVRFHIEDYALTYALWALNQGDPWKQLEALSSDDNVVRLATGLISRVPWGDRQKALPLLRYGKAERAVEVLLWPKRKPSSRPQGRALLIAARRTGLKQLPQAKSLAAALCDALDATPTSFKAAPAQPGVLLTPDGAQTAQEYAASYDGPKGRVEAVQEAFSVSTDRAAQIVRQAAELPPRPKPELPPRLLSVQELGPHPATVAREREERGRAARGEALAAAQQGELFTAPSEHELMIHDLVRENRRLAKINRALRVLLADQFAQEDI